MKKSMVVLLYATIVVLASGCSETPALVLAPKLYTMSEENPYADVPAEWQTADAKIIYATDRQSEQTAQGFIYGYKRCHDLNFGMCTVRMGDEFTRWDDLVNASRTAKRSSSIPLTLTRIEEFGQFPRITLPVEIDGNWVDDPDYVAGVKDSIKEFHELLAEQLAKTSRKEVYIFIHGYNNSFREAVYRAAQIWHFIGRQGVVVAYSWPAGSWGPLRGYTQDRESGEFTNAHLKEFLRAVVSCPEVQKVHLIGHSRGTDVLATALRELHIEYRAAGKNSRSELKLGQVVLAAPDMDLDVFFQKFTTDRVGFVPEQLTIYVSPDDKAIGIASWLFRSARRIGQLAVADVSKYKATGMEKHPVVSVVDVRVKTDSTGHAYFLNSPLVLSDLIFVLRDFRRPGAANGRPLTKEGAFWQLTEKYLQPVPDATSQPAATQSALE